MSRIYVYKLVAVNGGAPCDQEGLLSLAICKPAIRRCAAVGDLIFGFAGNTLYNDNRLIYAARITEIVSGQRYYGGPRHRNRRDCIYELVETVYRRRVGALYHDDPGALEHDLGAPPHYQNAVVPLSTDYRYFGTSGSFGYKIDFPRVRQSIESLGRGHRVNHGDDLQHELLSLWGRLRRSDVPVMASEVPVINAEACNPPARRDRRC
ncbi:MAG: hypothetical protein KGJ41_17470 [Rhodospirillales bacterium]|nr:hypothetical protein [Rhodospirillales bacterium]MDE2575823.1 hypothetical protein [Rhodospirillales bacterium]